MLKSILSEVSLIPGWGWFDIISTLLVLVGACGQLPKALELLTPSNPKNLMPIEQRRSRLKALFEFALIIGIAGRNAVPAVCSRGICQSYK